MELILIKVLVALMPAFAFVVVFTMLDAFKLMSLRELALLLGGGGALAVVAYFANGGFMDALPIGFSNYSRYAAPVMEECIKGALMLVLFARNRIGFMIDAAITGFAVGAGFSLVENVFYLTNFSTAALGVWLVRGFGTAVMHGGAVAIFGVAGQFLSERQLKRDATEWRFNPLLFLPGLAGAILLHGAYNQFPNDPVTAMGVTLLVVPLTLIFIFSRSAHAAHKWLLDDYAGHQHLLDDIRSGAYQQGEAGRVILSLAERFDDDVVADIFTYIQLHTELVVRAEEVLIAHQEGNKVTLEQEIRLKFDQLRDLERKLGRTALLAIRPHLHFSRNDLWEMHELEEDVRKGG